MDALFGGLDRLDVVVVELRKYPGWPADDAKDRAFAAEIMETFPGLNIAAECMAWRTWMMDHEQKRQVKPRARFLNWLRYARGDYGSRPTSSGTGSAQRRTSTAARPVDAFGPESRALSRW